MLNKQRRRKTKGKLQWVTYNDNPSTMEYPCSIKGCVHTYMWSWSWTYESGAMRALYYCWKHHREACERFGRDKYNTFDSLEGEKPLQRNPLQLSRDAIRTVKFYGVISGRPGLCSLKGCGESMSWIWTRYQSNSLRQIKYCQDHHVETCEKYGRLSNNQFTMSDGERPLGPLKPVKVKDSGTLHHVKSTDPRKCLIVQAIKDKFPEHASMKVTNVKEDNTHYQGDAMYYVKSTRSYIPLQTVRVVKEEVYG